MPVDCDITSLQHQLRALKARVATLELELQACEERDTPSLEQHLGRSQDKPRSSGVTGHQAWPLPLEDYATYGRQLIVPQIGLQGQMRLKASSTLIVGVGGLGCPAAVYLAGAGVGVIGLVDEDVVEQSNLHRQILHNTHTIGMSKVESASRYLKDLNPNIICNTYPTCLEPSNVLKILSQYDLVLDCTDNPAARYLISDACVLLCKPLVSASALRVNGQLIVLNNPPAPQGDASGGPCFRCVFPKPPPAEFVVSCGEGGILGPVVGVMGVLQALEAVKLIVAGIPQQSISKGDVPEPAGAELLPAPSLLLFSAFAPQLFRQVRIRSRRADCPACSLHATITKECLTSGSLDYVAFCGVVRPVTVLDPEERITAREFAEFRQKCYTSIDGNDSHEILVDVREKVQFQLCNLPGSINIPYSEIESLSLSDTGNEDAQSPEKVSLNSLLQLQMHVAESPLTTPIHVICRLGNDSQLAVQKLKAVGLDHGGQRRIMDIKGGWKAWRAEVDGDWPDY